MTMLKRKQVSKVAKASEQRNYSGEAFLKVERGDRVSITKKKKDPKDSREEAETIYGTVMSKSETCIMIRPADGGISKRVLLTEIARLSRR